ncbi:gas vesicle protein GvpH [Haloprofundus salinisoli]|uniref:gas vesicle protein GvpH n=1 Tax=Haloprofundus salinisoli TaxID=2876193 RepID=UPI001CCC7804|nr:gas vesicle protein GvpH [Haloprofundus salinisoli]
MTDDPVDRHGDDPDEWPSRGIVARVQSLLETLAAMDRSDEDRRIGTGEGNVGSADVDFGYSIRTGISDRPEDGPERTYHTPSDDSFDPSNVHLDSRVDGDSYQIVADVPGISAARIDAELRDDGRTLVVTVDDQPVGRVSFDRPMRLVETVVRNHVLHARLELREVA